MLRQAGLRLARAVSQSSLPAVVRGPNAAQQQVARFAVAGGGKHGIDIELRNSALATALKSIETTYGAGTLMRLGGDSVNKDVPVIPTGSLALNAALGIGGLPRGRVVEIYGPEASGKTTLALHAVAEAQKRGGTAVYIDVEHALDATYVAALGVDVGSLLFSQPDSGEQALSLADTLVRSASVDLVVIDSVAALVPKAELEGDIGDPHMALQARLMSQALRKMTHEVSRTNTTLLFINQVRSSIGGFGGFGGAPAEVTSGGRALKFYASVRLDIRRISQVKKGDEVTGAMLRIKVVKNKLAPPLRTVEVELEYGKGIVKEAELLDLGVREGLIHRAGAWYRFANEKEKFAQGRDRAKQYLRDNRTAAEALEAELITRLRTSGKFASTRSIAGTPSGALADDGLLGEDDLTHDEDTETGAARA